MAHLVLWRRLDLPGHEFAALVALNDFWELSGTAVFAPDSAPCRHDYFIRCDSRNLLPILRLTLNFGQQVEVRAAWLPVPSLTFEVLPQLYHRESQDTYRYESANGAFVRQLK